MVFCRTTASKLDILDHNITPLFEEKLTPESKYFPANMT